MKRTFLSVKELAHELGISQDSVYRAFRAGEIPGAQIARTIRFDPSKVQRAMEERAKAMPNRRCTTRAPGVWICRGNDSGYGRIATGAKRAPREVHVDLSQELIRHWSYDKFHQLAAGSMSRWMIGWA